jgi:hypothetical protein
MEQKEPQNTPQVFNYSSRMAVAKDLDFVFGGKLEIFRIQKTSEEVLKEFNEYEREDTLDAILKNKILLAEHEGGTKKRKRLQNNRFFFFFLWIHTVPVGFIWFEFSNQSPYGVGYGQWWNKYLWISYVYTDKGLNQKK